MKFKLPFEIRISLIYIIIGGLWILFSDEFVLKITSDLYMIKTISIYKGWAYVVITGILLYLVVRRDGKKRNRLYKELYAQQQRALEADNLKTAFLSNLSHYIRTPMNCILGFADLLKDKSINQNQREDYFGYIQNRGQVLLQTLSNIIDLSKIQEGQIAVVPVSFSCNELIAKLVSEFQIEIITQKKDIKIIVLPSAENGDDTIIADDDKISYIFSQLLSNAINFSLNGTITISYKVINNRFVFSVADTGCGVSDSKMQMLFTNYLNNSYTTAVFGEGSGLGLYLSSRLAQLMGGKLWLEKTSPQGSIFSFEIVSAVN